MIFLISFFFIKQKTAYDMRISAWSSDVCSSDLAALAVAGLVGGLDHLGAEPPAFGQDRLHHFRLGSGKARKIGVAFKVKDIVVDEQRVLHGRAIARHAPLLSLGFFSPLIPPAPAARPSNGGKRRLQPPSGRQALDRKSAGWGRSVSVRV